MASCAAEDQAIKAKHDPNNLIRVNRKISPSASKHQARPVRRAEAGILRGYHPRDGIPWAIVSTWRDMTNTFRDPDLTRFASNVGATDTADVADASASVPPVREITSAEEATLRANRALVSTWSLCAALCLIAACVPPGGTWPFQPQPGRSTQSMQSTKGYEDEDVAEDEASPSMNGRGGSGSGGGSWTCKAMATFVDALPIETMGQGNTRDDAYYNAFSDCNSLMTTTMMLDQAGGTSRQIQSDCHVTECNQW